MRHGENHVRLQALHSILDIGMHGKTGILDTWLQVQTVYLIQECKVRPVRRVHVRKSRLLYWIHMYCRYKARLVHIMDAKMQGKTGILDTWVQGKSSMQDTGVQGKTSILDEG